MNVKLGINNNTILFLRRNKENVLKFLSIIKTKIESKIWQTTIERIVRKTKDVYFVEIGAWDGGAYDPLYNFVSKYGFKGIYVEPQKIGFQELQKARGKNKNMNLVNAAIRDKDGIDILYSIMKRDGKIAAGQSSFDKDIILRKIEIDKKFQINSYQSMVEEPTDCFTFERLLKKYDVKKIDILQIDTEGGDYNILKTVPFHLIKPKVIRFERVLLSEDEKKKSVELLKKQGYHLIKAGMDYIAIVDLHGIRVLVIVAGLLQSVYHKIAYHSHLLALKWKSKSGLNSTEP